MNEAYRERLSDEERDLIQIVEENTARVAVTPPPPPPPGSPASRGGVWQQGLFMRDLHPITTHVSWKVVSFTFLRGVIQGQYRLTEWAHARSHCLGDRYLVVDQHAISLPYCITRHD